MPRKTALLIVDMINLLNFPEAKSLLEFATPAAKNIVQLKKQFYKKNLPVIYVNDNFGEWLADWKAVYSKCSATDKKGHKLAKLLKPTKKDYFILKPRHSGFEATPLEILLKKLKVKKLVITGIAGDICVLFTAHDAHARNFEVIVPRDCIASNTEEQNEVALKQLSKSLRLKTTDYKHLHVG
jgi:nicotinamidase-related amidase